METPQHFVAPRAFVVAIVYLSLFLDNILLTVVGKCKNKFIHNSFILNLQINLKLWKYIYGLIWLFLLLFII